MILLEIRIFNEVNFQYSVNYRQKIKSKTDFYFTLQPPLYGVKVSKTTYSLSLECNMSHIKITTQNLKWTYIYYWIT
jgi:hypothetical protein